METEMIFLSYAKRTAAAHAIGTAIFATSIAYSDRARAQPPAPISDSVTPDEPTSGFDPTGGAYTAPTLLFIPAAAVPKWDARTIVSTDIQAPANASAGVRPGLGLEVGLPAGVTLGAGTNWVGGDVNPNTGRTDFNLGLSPYLQARLHLLGDGDGRGWQLGTSAAYKFVGFEGDPGELELASSLQYRAFRYEIGIQVVLGQDLEDAGGHDAELHAYAVYRPVPNLALGAAGQGRVSLSPDEGSGENSYDIIGGTIASFTVSRYQLGVLAGGSTLGLNQGHVGALGQIFATARF
jgi:hypothetical protein